MANSPVDFGPKFDALDEDNEEEAYEALTEVDEQEDVVA